MKPGQGTRKRTSMGAKHWLTSEPTWQHGGVKGTRTLKLVESLRTSSAPSALWLRASPLITIIVTPHLKNGPHHLLLWAEWALKTLEHDKCPYIYIRYTLLPISLQHNHFLSHTYPQSQPNSKWPKMLSVPTKWARYYCRILNPHVWTWHIGVILSHFFKLYL